MSDMDELGYWLSKNYWRLKYKIEPENESESKPEKEKP